MQEIQCELPILAVLLLTGSLPEPGPNPGPSPCVLIRILHCIYPHSPLVTTNSFPRFLGFFETFPDSSMDPVLSVVRAQYYFPHLSILSSESSQILEVAYFPDVLNVC